MIVKIEIAFFGDFHSYVPAKSLRDALAKFVNNLPSEGVWEDGRELPIETVNSVGKKCQIGKLQFRAGRELQG